MQESSFLAQTLEFIILFCIQSLTRAATMAAITREKTLSQFLCCVDSRFQSSNKSLVTLKY